MNQKNLNALNKIHKNLLNYLKDQKINQIYKKFELSLDKVKISLSQFQVALIV